MKYLSYLANSTNKLAQFFIYLAGVLVILVCVIRFIKFPTFWLDEAWVANALQHPSLETIFSRLPNGVIFPRFYLSIIACFCHILGYKIWVLRFFPSLFFILATILWVKFLSKRLNNSFFPSLLASALLISSFYWLEQAIQLKQYSLDVLLALIPFFFDDKFYEDLFSNKQHKIKIIFLSIFCLFSYVYPISLFARILGWYLYTLKSQFSWPKVSLLFISTSCCIVITYFTDHQFNYLDKQAYLRYWHDCVLLLDLDFYKNTSLILKFFCGWYVGRLLPLVLAVIIPLQILGLYQILKDWKTISKRTKTAWGSRSLAGLILMVMVLFASMLMTYPICAGRLLLFLQPHFQILILEGFFLIFSWRTETKSRIFIYLVILIMVPYSAYRYVSFAKEEPWEDLTPILSLINPELSDTLWVEPCSVGQVMSLPNPLPVKNLIAYKTRKNDPPTGKKIWILWTGLGTSDCKNRLNEVKLKSISWQIIYVGSGSGLALAQF